MNNFVFGKTLENIRNRIDIRLISSDKVAQKLVAKPNYAHCTIFDENLIAVHMKNTKLYFNKPVYIVMSILGLSKFMMYDFHYNYIKTKYGDEAKLLLTDTDSLAYEIKTKDFYKDIKPDIAKRFDTSDYQTNHPSEIKQDLIVKCLEWLRMKLVGSRMLNLLVWELNFTPKKCLMALKIKNARGLQRMLQKGVFNSMTTENACLAARNNIEK